MKELTIEQKAKAYDEALEKAKQIILEYDYDEHDNVFMEIFPELKESEGERIRKELIEHVKDQQSSFISAPDCRDKYEEEENNKYNSWLAWLEKQGEQKPIIEMKSAEESLGIDSETNNKIVDECIYGEQKPTDKVEPKFKIGDWAVFDGETLHITNVTENGYSTEDGAIPFRCEKETKPWTIADAKNGDVFTCNEEILLFKSYSVQNRISLYCWYNGRTNNFHSKEVDDTLLTTRNKICPATREQRDLLFSKMKEAGYEWDADKKELKKIHVIDEGKAEMDYCFTKMMNGEKVSSGWSEEDEHRVKDTIYFLETAKKHYASTVELDACINWLKYIRPQKQWKPTKEQMDALLFVVQHYTPKVTDKIAWDSLKTLELMYYEIKQ